jgi:hypothetical protein
MKDASREQRHLFHALRDLSTHDAKAALTDLRGLSNSEFNGVIEALERLGPNQDKPKPPNYRVLVKFVSADGLFRLEPWDRRHLHKEMRRGIPTPIAGPYNFDKDADPFAKPYTRTYRLHHIEEAEFCEREDTIYEYREVIS